MRDVYMALISNGSVFIKEIEFYRSQGGFTQDWGKNWIPIVATGVEDAREKACQLPGALPYSRQAK